MNKSARSGHTVDFLFVITLFLLFAMSSLAMIGVGAKVYENSADSLMENAKDRTAYLYFTEKIRQNDVADAIELGSFDGYEALIIERFVGEDSYRTYLYLYDGYLCEMQVKAGNESSVDAGSGQKVMELNAFTVTFKKDNLLFFSIEDSDGEREEFQVALRSAA